MAVIAWAVAALLFGLGMFLYRKRPSEAAGRAMAFKVSEPVIRFLLVVPITLFSGMIFRSILNDDIWTVFGLLCGLLITSCLIEIIYHSILRACLRIRDSLPLVRWQWQPFS